MGEGGHNFLHVMGHQNQGWGVPLESEAVEELQKVFASHRVQASAGFIEDQQLGLGHESAANKDALAFALRQVAPRAIGDGGAFDLF